MHQNVMILDDEEDLRIYVTRRLQKENLTVKVCSSPSEALAMMNSVSFDIILTDYRMNEMSGLEFFEQASQRGLLEHTLVILMTAYGTLEMGVEAIKKGFHEYLIKPFNIDDLIFRIRKGLQFLHLNDTIQVLSGSEEYNRYNIIGESDEIKKVFTLVRQVASKDVSILIEGETGTGKELIAKAIHMESKRKAEVFIPIHCGAIPENLIESELFGYEKGAFTGAIGKKFGLLETANKGTVFFDEINSLPFNMQVKLLRFIETKEFIKVGGNKVMEADIRLIAASNQDLEKLVQTGGFREDLYHRLNIIKIVAPPLRKRRSDIPMLIEYFLGFYNGRFNKRVVMDRKLHVFFVDYAWEGNIRQLKNLIQHLVLLNVTGTIQEEDLPEYLLTGRTRTAAILPFKQMKQKVVTDFEKTYLLELLRHTEGNVLQASRLAQIDRKYLINRLKYYKLNAKGFKQEKTKK